MPDGSLTDTSTDEGQPGDTEQSVSQDAQSVEEVEAIWRNRMSGKDKAHAAETKALRDQIAGLESQQKANPQQGGDDPREAEIARLRQELEQTKIVSAIETRKAKYPFASDSLDDETLARMDEARLAGLNARLGTEAEPQRRGSYSDPNAAQRRTQTATPPTEKSPEDLKSDLRKYSPGFVNDLFGG